MPNNTRTYKYSDWSKGEYGTLGGENAPRGSFTGYNLLPYASGLLGPRPGLKTLKPENMPNGILRGFAPTPTPGRDGIFIIGDKAFRFNLFDPTGDTPVEIGTIPNFTGEIVFPKLDTVTNIATTVTEGAVRIDHVNDTIEDLGSPSGHALAIYNSQLILAENTSSNKIFGSALGAVDDWSGGYAFQVGDNWQVTALELQRNTLVIFKRTGIHVASGGPLTNENTSVSIRRASGADAVLHPWWVAADSNESLWFLPLFRRSPAVWTGSQVQYFGNLVFPTYEDETTAALPPTKRSVVNFTGQLTTDSQAFIQGGDSNSMFLRHNGIWSYHTFGVPVSAMTRNVENNLVFTDGGAADAPANFYATRFDIDRPAFTTDGLFSPWDGDNFTPIPNGATLPYFSNDEGSLVRVRSLTVKLKKWKTGVPTNTFTIQLTTLNRQNGQGDYAHAPDVWSETQDSASIGGTHDRITFPKHAAWGLGWQISVSGLIGCAIDDILVEYETSENLPRTNSGR